MISASEIHNRIIMQSEAAIRRSRELLAASEPLVRIARWLRSPAPSPNGSAAPHSGRPFLDREPDDQPTTRPRRRARP